MKSRATPPVIAVTPSFQRKGEEFSDRSLSLSLCYTSALEEAGAVPVIAPLTAAPKTLHKFLDSVDGLMLTGGGDVHPRFYKTKPSAPLRNKLGGVDTLRDEMELELLREAERRQMPVLGICRGHQVLNVARGGTLVVDIPTQLAGTLRHNRTDRKNDPVHDIVIEPGSRLAAIFGRTRLAVNSSHHQAIDQLAPGLHVSARSVDGVIEGIETDDGTFTVGVQFHPERMWRKYREIFPLFRAFVAAVR